MSRSTWACELKFKDLSIWVNALMTSRSTWACELKSFYSDRETKITRHAPRERVSWNVQILFDFCHCQVTLHVSVWVEIVSVSIVVISESGHAPRERVSWNTKCIARLTRERSHAPRERVSWNHFIVTGKPKSLVTLHVSVWVEMFKFFLIFAIVRSRSTWACELKSFLSV